MRWNKRSVALAALAAAGVAIVVWMRAGDDDPGIPPPAMKTPPAAVTPPRDADARALQTQRPADVAQESANAASAPATAQLPAPMVIPPQPPPVALPAPPASAAVANPKTDRPIDILLTAPAEANNGSTVEVSLGVAAERAVQSAVFRVSYDPALLEPLDVGTANGIPSPPENGASAELELSVDLQQGTVQPVIRFIAHAPAPQSTEITVTAQVWDPAGNSMAVGPPASQTLIVWP